MFQEDHQDKSSYHLSTYRYYISIAYIPHIVHCILMTFMLQLEICTSLSCSPISLPPSCLAPLATTSLIFVSESFCFVTFVHLFCFLNSICKWNYTVFVLVWLISLSTILCRSIHVVANGKISLFFYGWAIVCCVYVYICIYACLCVWMEIYIYICISPLLYPFLGILITSISFSYYK